MITSIIGKQARFYDCDRANKDKNHSGSESYYSVGMIINRRLTEKYFFIDRWMGGDDVVDIQLPDGRISNGHFTNLIELI